MLGALGITLWLPSKTDAQGDAGVAVAAAPPPPQRAAEPTPAEAAPVAAPGAGIGSLDWGALRARVAACRACRLCESRTQTVFGVGNLRAHCMIVGEAPGENEDRQGEPFVGAAGQLLDRMLPAVGLTRGEADPSRQVFIANTLKCRPPRNRNPEPEELVRCSAYLIRQIELVQPRALLAVGRIAAQWLLQTDIPIGRIRGKVLSFGPRNTPLVVTYHPAYLLRSPLDKAKAWTDLCLVKELLSRPS